MKDRKIKVDGILYQVKYVETIPCDSEDHFLCGNHSGIDNTITIATKKPNGKDLPKQALEIAYLHEIMHAILTQGQYLEANANESLVEYLAKRIYELKKQNAL
jgi:hypothetical protein